MRKTLALALGMLALSLFGCGPGGGGLGGEACVLRGSLDSECTLSPGACNPYRVEGDFVIEDTGKLVIEPGVVLEFAQDASLMVTGHGVLRAEGTAADPVVMRGASPQPGYWKGIYFTDANNFENRLVRVEVRDAAGERNWDNGAFGNFRAAVVLEGASRVLVKFTKVWKNAGAGFFIDDEVDLRNDFDDNVVTANQGFPVLIYASRVDQLKAGNDFTGNASGYDYVRVGGGFGEVQDATWKKLNVPYRIFDEVTVADGKTLTIEPGTTLVFEQDAGIFVEGRSGGLHAEGTATERIVFTGLDHHQGYWCGIIFSDSDSFENLLRNVVVEYGGSGQCTQSYSGLKANVLVESAGSGSHQYIRIYDSVIRESAGYGVVVAQETDANDIASDNTFSGNALGDFYREP